MSTATLSADDFVEMSSSTMATLTNSNATKNFNFGIVDYIVFVIMLLASTSVGIYFGFFAKAKNTTTEYLMGGKKMKTIPIAISLVASQLSCVSIMSVPVENYSFGFNYIIIALSMVISVPVLNYIIVPFFYENKFDNCYEYLEKRFNVLSRQLVTASFVLHSFLILPILMFVPSLAFSQVTGINIHLINITVSSICVFYTMLGGVKAVVWTDVIQGSIMLATVVLVGVMGTIKVGGIGKVLENATEGGRMDFNFSWDPRVRITVWNAFLGGAVMCTGHIGLNQSCAQRIVALPSLQHARRALWITGIGIILVVGFSNINGIVMYAYYHHCDPVLAGRVEKLDKMMSYFVQDIMGHLQGLPGIFVSCVFSAALSTLSAVLNALSGVVYFDYIKPFIRHTDERANSIMKSFVVIMGFYCVLGGLVVQQFDSILQMMLTFSGICKGAIFGVFLLGMFVPRANGKVAVVSFAMSILTLIWIVFNTHMRMRAGLIKYEPLPTKIDGCDAMNINVLIKSFTNSSSSTQSTIRQVTTAWSSNRDFSIYEISFYWYMVVGALVVWITAIPLSFVWKRDKNEKQDPKLYSPIVRTFLTPSIVELDEISPLKEPQNDLALKETNVHSEKS